MSNIIDKYMEQIMDKNPAISQVYIEFPVMESYDSQEMDGPKFQKIIVKCEYVIRNGVKGEAYRMKCKVKPHDLKLLGTVEAIVTPITTEDECENVTKIVINFTNIVQRI